MTKIRCMLLVTTASVLWPCLAAGSESYPSKPIRLIAPYPAGGTTDILARAITDASGEAAFTWKVGAAPVENEIVLTADRAQTAASTRATLAVPAAVRVLGEYAGNLFRVGRKKNSSID